MIRIFGSVTGITNQPQGLDLGFSGGASIKNISKYTANYTNRTSMTVAISAVDPSKTVVFIDKLLPGGGFSPDYSCIEAVLTNPTTITLSSITANAGITITLAITVVEFNNVKSLQRGEAVLGTTANSVNVTISAVDTTKAMLICGINFKTTSTTLSGATNNFVPYSTMTNATTLNFQVPGNTSTSVATFTFAYQVIEFN